MKLRQPKNESWMIVLRFLESVMVLLKFSHWVKALSPIIATKFGIIKDPENCNPRKQLDPIVVAFSVIIDLLINFVKRKYEGPINDNDLDSFNVLFNPAHRLKEFSH